MKRISYIISKGIKGIWGWRKAMLLAMVLVFALTIWANSSVTKTAKSFITDDIDKVAATRVGLLLGTSKHVKSGKLNDYFFNRIDATVALFNKGKIKSVIISGDNGSIYYNEPMDMKKELVKNGIPDSVITLDYAGFRTLDAVVRAKEIFGQDTFLIISQKFHNERAVYLARHYGINAFGFNAKEVRAYKGFKTQVREIFARDKMFLDLIFGVKPKFLGPKEKIN